MMQEVFMKELKTCLGHKVFFRWLHKAIPWLRTPFKTDIKHFKSNLKQHPAKPLLYDGELMV